MALRHLQIKTGHLFAFGKIRQSKTLSFTDITPEPYL